MQILSGRWGIHWGHFTLDAALKSDALEIALNASADANAIPFHPEGEVKVVVPCGIYDPNAETSTRLFLTPDGTWLGVGVRAVTNAPNPATVEALFRARAQAQFGDGWPEAKKKWLAGLHAAVKSELAEKTPFRLAEAGALLICLNTGQAISIGKSGIRVSLDICGRIPALKSVAWSEDAEHAEIALLGLLQRQSESIHPWPTGTASLRRTRDESKETCSVKDFAWGQEVQDAVDLLAQGWMPCKIEMQWEDERKARVGMTGRIESVAWGRKIQASDPSNAVELRLSRLLQMDADVRALLLGSPLSMPA